LSEAAKKEELNLRWQVGGLITNSSVEGVENVVGRKRGNEDGKRKKSSGVKGKKVGG
jgi:hypothetical protein